MSSIDTTRFLRPVDLAALPRNHRRIQLRRLLVLTANVLLVVCVLLAAAWLVQQLHRDHRFAVTSIQIEGTVHSDPGRLRSIFAAWEGANLFELDIDVLRAQVTAVPWVEDVSIEKRVPDTVVVRVRERVPVALALEEGRLRYVDRSGVVVAPLSVDDGNDDLPIVRAGSLESRRRAVEFLEMLAADHPDLYQRVGELAPIEPSGFRLFDRDLRARLFLPAEGGVDRWRQVHALAKVEEWGRSGLEYADLRFARRIVVLPRAYDNVRKSSAAGRVVTAAVVNQG